MNIILKSAGAAALVGALALTSMTSAEARNRWIGPAAAGFAAGAIVGGAAAGAYGPRYYDSGYAYGPAYNNTYAYETPAYDAYAYEAAPVYAPVYAPRYYRSGSRGCASQGNYGQSVDESACNR